MTNVSLLACASMQDDLKTTQSARNREAKQMAQLERTRQRNPSDRQIIVSFACLSNSVNIHKTPNVTATFYILFFMQLTSWLQFKSLSVVDIN